MTLLPSSDTDYFRWLAAHPSGYVLNTRRKFDGYYVLHRASCVHISQQRVHRPGAYTEHRYIKVCSENKKELVGWLRKKGCDLDEQEGTCRTCMH
ncbi:MAG TPA: hypothetical protein DCG19_07995 [Cryomorphaceae bacterium]|nr:hypothetical protein [Owenweeksia sp.]HAD97333.1 hypothetical protein [Cryomorphaceae bacterium]HBF21710.1 hypothetical protein [Cryomorphaceae bacterium]HCQ16234.1 hypothetical protein [Cryomorphaceae bacterium]